MKTDKNLRAGKSLGELNSVAVGNGNGPAGWGTLGNIMNGLCYVYAFDLVCLILGIYFTGMPKDVCRDVYSRKHSF